MAAFALELRGITRRFGDTIANSAVDFSLERGRIAALVGENGAGKSTLMHVAFGLVSPDAGTISIAGESVGPSFSPQEAMRRRVGMVHQHFMLVEDLSVAENVVLGREPMIRGLFDRERANSEVKAVAAEFGVDIEPTQLIEELSVGEKQRVEILKALWRGCDVLILDEPTAVLTPAEVAVFFETIRGLSADGMAVVIITHKLDEVFEIADEITVMRRGKVVGKRDRQGSTPAEIAELMVGRAVATSVSKTAAAPGEVMLEVRELSVRRPRGDVALDRLSLSVRSGEIVGIAGVEGNGQRELVAAIAGVRRGVGGSISIAGRDVTAKSVAARRHEGLALIPEDRHDMGLVLEFTTAENLILGRTAEFATTAGLNRDEISENAAAEIAKHDIRPTDPDAIASGLSGGNQQKIVIARELDRDQLTVLVASQPTRGVDIGAIERIHAEIVGARDAGLAVLLISAELSELRALSDRLVVLYKGKIAAELDAKELADPASGTRIGAMMTGAAESESSSGEGEQE